MSENKKRERFGRYLLLDHLVDGGMAKICRARFLGEQADKVVALKMVQEKYSKDESYKKMFMDEIKVTFGLIHPNIVQTYDYGMYKEQLFVAMEYCDGRNLKEYLEKLKKRQFVFPVEISTYIVIQVCQGLHYAHTYEDKLTGKASRIIHRDISPHNIMLTYDGSVKIIDFGIAKSKVNVEHTQAGTIKGKLSYLAPEYLEGLELDARYDLFAAGITLWEMLCSRKLFKAKNDLAILKKIQECEVPRPSSINPNVPKELDEIVLKALSKDRENRYKNMDQLNRELMKFLYSFYPEFNATDLTYFAKELFKEEIAEDRAKLYEFGKIDIKPYLNDYYNEANSSSGMETPASSPASAPLSKANEIDFGFSDKDKNATKFLDKDDSLIDVSSPGSSARSTKYFGAKNKTKTQQASKSKSVEPSRMTNHTRIQVKEKVEKTSFLKLNVIAASVALVIFLLYHKREEIGLSKLILGENQVSPQDTPTTDPTNQAKKKFGILSLKDFDSTKHRLYINGVERESDLLGEVKLPIGFDYVLRIQSKNREHFVANFRLTDQRPTAEVKIPLTSEARFGYLLTSRDCINGKIYFELFGEKRVESLPINPDNKVAFPLKNNGEGRLPASQTYTVEYQIKGEDFKRRTEFTVSREADLVDFCDYLNFN
jgi:eukaryotic-like serine/threonine-protein kinase